MSGALCMMPAVYDGSQISQSLHERRKNVGQTEPGKSEKKTGTYPRVRVRVRVGVRVFKQRRVFLTTTTTIFILSFNLFTIRMDWPAGS